MKKILTLLLTIVMVFGLVTFYNNYAKADEGNDINFAIGLTNSGFVNDDQGTSITDQYGLVFETDGDGNPVWRFTQPLASTARLIIYVEGTISIEDNVSFSYNAPSPVIHFFNGNEIGVNITGKNNSKLTLVNTYDGPVIGNPDANYSMSLSNIVLEAKTTNCDTFGTYNVYNLTSLKYDDKTKLILESDSGHVPLKIDINDTNSVQKGAVSKGQTLEDVQFNNVSKQYELVSNQAQVHYLEIYKEVPPTPSPSEPVVKDESCEKVIGPTWHWNNTKGICEEYATVGTSTR